MANLEARGIPTVGVATTEFIQGAEAQAKALGTDPAWCSSRIRCRTAPTTSCASSPTTFRRDLELLVKEAERVPLSPVQQIIALARAKY